MTYSPACCIETRQLVWVKGNFIGTAAEVAAMGRQGVTIG